MFFNGIVYIYIFILSKVYGSLSVSMDQHVDTSLKFLMPISNCHL